MADVTVVGGGPAGSAAAARLAQAGMKVRLYEKRRFPRSKLCGGHLSAEALPELRELGLLEAVESSDAALTRRVVVSSPRGVRAATTLSSPVLSVSRPDFDALLLNRAREFGVEVREEVDGWNELRSSRWGVVATGRSPYPGENRDPRARAHFGAQALFDGVAGITDQVELDMIPGGYIGLVRQGKYVNVCGLFDRSAIRRHGSDLDQAMRGWARENPMLDQRLSGARRVSPWQTVGPVVMGLRRLSEENLFFVGDAACVVDPFVGEGMAMALTSGRLLRDAFVSAPENPGPLYQSLWHRQFDGERRIQRAICWAIGNPWWQEIVALSCRTFPSLMRWLTDSEVSDLGLQQRVIEAP